MDNPRETMEKRFQRKQAFRRSISVMPVLGLAMLVLIYMAFFADRTSTYKVDKDKLIIETSLKASLMIISQYREQLNR